MARSFLDALREALMGEKGRRQDVEIGEELSPRRSVDMELAMEGGIYLSPTRLVQGDTMSVRYNGLLARSGAEQVFLHCGYGPGPWQRITDLPMFKNYDESWETSLTVEQNGTLEFCFRDNGDNWDNNGGRNWSYAVMSDMAHNPT